MDWLGSTNFEESTAYKDEVLMWMNKIHSKQSQQGDLKHQQNEHLRKEQSMNSHIYLSEVGVQHAGSQQRQSRQPSKTDEQNAGGTT